MGASVADETRRSRLHGGETQTQNTLAGTLGGDLHVLPFAVYPAPDGALSLLPHDAVLHGPSLKVEQVGVIGDVKYNIGYWLDPAEFVSWPISGQRAGKYRVVAELGCKNESAGSMAVLECGESRIGFKVDGTGGWQDYRAVEPGNHRCFCGKSFDRAARNFEGGRSGDEPAVAAHDSSALEHATSWLDLRARAPARGELTAPAVRGRARILRFPARRIR